VLDLVSSASASEPRSARSGDGLRSGPYTPEHGASAWLAQRAHLTPQREALVDGDLRLTYGQLWERVRRCAGLLRSLGVGPSDRVATLAMNGHAVVELLYATAEVGAILAPLNWRLAAPELDFQIRDAGVRALFVGPEHRALADALARDLPIRARIDLEREYGERRDASEPADASRRARFTDAHVILYTSGTTGHPKGAVLTHANEFWNAVNVTIGFGLSERDTTLTVLPTFHSGGLGLFTLPTLTIGARVVLHPKFDAVRMLETVRRERVDLAFGVPAIWLELAKRDDFTPRAYPSLRALPSGGAPLPVALIERLAARGWAVLQGYGLTETAPGGTIVSVDDWRRKAGSVGKAFPFTELRVVGDDERALPAGEIGEVHFRGPNVFAGYWNRPDATADAFTADGWFRSGDLGRLDEEGFLTLVDRKKDMVISGGENVYSAEVEDVLFAHPAVAEAAIIGVPDERWGEAVCAVVALRPSQRATADELIAHCRTRLAKYKTPKYVVFVDALPRNAAGKVLKRTLREEVASRQGIA
jgi:fatty-acyl-CoA synthase